jgi:hypothetical protein
MNGLNSINDFENVRVPSWSWMAYKGEVSYTDIPANGLRWKGDVRFTFCRFGLQAERWCALKAPLAQISRGCDINRNRCTNYGIMDETDSLVGWIKYDKKQDKEHDEGDKVGVERVRQKSRASYGYRISLCVTVYKIISLKECVGLCAAEIHIYKKNS